MAGGLPISPLSPYGRGRGKGWRAAGARSCVALPLDGGGLGGGGVGGKGAGAISICCILHWRGRLQRSRCLASAPPPPCPPPSRGRRTRRTSKEPLGGTEHRQILPGTGRGTAAEGGGGGAAPDSVPVPPPRCARSPSP